MRKSKNLQYFDKKETTQIINFTFFYQVKLEFLEKAKTPKQLETKIM